MKRIRIYPESNGDIFALVDDDDFDEMNKFRWNISMDGYARARIRIGVNMHRSILMHREIIKTPVGKCTDHINGDRLDNRKSNLRICDRKENTRNRKIPNTNTSGYKGVSIRSSIIKGKRYSYIVANIAFNGKIIFLGSFDSFEDGARAYNEASKKYHGEFSQINEGV